MHHRYVRYDDLMYYYDGVHWTARRRTANGQHGGKGHARSAEPRGRSEFRGLDDAGRRV